VVVTLGQPPEDNRNSFSLAVVRGLTFELFPDFLKRAPIGR